MSREIKFRIWDTGLKKFINPFNIYLNENNSLLFMDGLYKFQQCTGLKDINGIEIYEGDIVFATIKRLGEDKYVVTYQPPSFILTFLPEDLEVAIPINTNFSDVTKIEVIGNIFEQNGRLTTL